MLGYSVSQNLYFSSIFFFLISGVFVNVSSKKWLFLEVAVCFLPILFLENCRILRQTNKDYPLAPGGVARSRTEHGNDV